VFAQILSTEVDSRLF